MARMAAEYVMWVRGRQAALPSRLTRLAVSFERGLTACENGNGG